MYIETRNGKPYAALTVPKEVQLTLGKTKYLKLLELGSPKKNQLEASALVLGWKKEISIAKALLVKEKANPLLHLIEQALIYKREIGNSVDDEEKQALEEILFDITEQVELKHGTNAAVEFHRVAMDLSTPLLPHYVGWVDYLKSEGYKEKTADTYARDALLFINKFKVSQAVTKKSVKVWISELAADGATANTLSNRVIKGVRNFWTYLIDQGAVDDDETLLLKVTPRSRKTKSSTLVRTREAFTPEEVLSALQAVPKKDLQLPSVIQIGMYTGCRIEEICTLKVSGIVEVDGIKCLTIGESKTKAGYRKIPIHSKLLTLIDTLLKEAKDEYLIHGLTLNKYDERSSVMSKRFARVRTAQGHGPSKVFHSIRMTVITQLERAEVPRNVVADIVGHDKNDVTFGVYSEGNSMVTLKKAMELLHYE